MNKNKDIGESCDSKPNYLCSVKQQDEQAHLVYSVCLVHPVTLV